MKENLWRDVMESECDKMNWRKKRVIIQKKICTEKENRYIRKAQCYTMKLQREANFGLLHRGTKRYKGGKDIKR